MQKKLPFAEKKHLIITIIDVNVLTFKTKYNGYLINSYFMSSVIVMKDSHDNPWKFLMVFMLDWLDFLNFDVIGNPLLFTRISFGDKISICLSCNVPLFVLVILWTNWSANWQALKLTAFILRTNISRLCWFKYKSSRKSVLNSDQLSPRLRDDGHIRSCRPTDRRADSLPYVLFLFFNRCCRSYPWLSR